MRHDTDRRFAKLSSLALVAALTGSAACNQRQDTKSRESAVSESRRTTSSGPGLAGKLRDDLSQPLARKQVLACMSTICLFGETDSAGDFFFPIEHPAEVALKTPEDLSVFPRRGAALLPVRIAGTSPINVGDVYVPLLPDGVPIGPASKDPQTVAVGDGLELTLRRANLTPRAGDTLVDAAARLIPVEQRSSLAALVQEPVVAVYALHPFGAHSRSPIAVRAALNLPSGTRVNFRTIDEIDGHFSVPVPGVANGQTVETLPSVGIVELTWLVISTPSPSVPTRTSNNGVRLSGGGR